MKRNKFYMLKHLWRVFLLWRYFPYLRFGQFVEYSVRDLNDIFYVEDNRLCDYMRYQVNQEINRREK